MKLKKINYKDLTARQQEAFNFQKVSAVLADYGFITIKLSDDWQGADFIAQHNDGQTFLKVQLKGRLTFDKKYEGKDIFICFCHDDNWYLAPHDEFSQEINSINNYQKTLSWERGTYSFPKLNAEILSLVEKYRL